MARQIWVRVTDPKGIFYQDIIDEVTGEVSAQVVRAETIDGRPVPVPVQVEDTMEVRQAIGERVAGQPAEGKRTRLVECTEDEVNAYLGQQILAPAPETSGSKTSKRSTSSSKADSTGSSKAEQTGPDQAEA
jgi:hypothetical protein